MLDLAALPKVELHRHLEGSVRPATALEIARAHGVALPTESLEELRARLQVLQPMDSLARVLAVFDFIARLFTSEDVLERLAYEVVSDAAADNIRLLEVRYSPDYIAQPAGLSWDRVTEAVVRGVQRAAREHDVTVGLIAIVSRHLGVDSARRTVEHALRWRQELVGFDLASDERGWPSSRFRDALAPLRGTGLGLTVHSGEDTGPEYVLETLEALGAQRLGHGVAVARDAVLRSRAVTRRVCIEACPTSNLRTRAVPSLRAHPAAELLRAGVPVCLNTDDPGLFDLTLSGELAVAREHLGFSDGEILQAQRHALAASFLPEDVKARTAARHFRGWLRTSA